MLALRRRALSFDVRVRALQFYRDEGAPGGGAQGFVAPVTSATCFDLVVVLAEHFSGTLSEKRTVGHVVQAAVLSTVHVDASSVHAGVPVYFASISTATVTTSRQCDWGIT